MSYSFPFRVRDMALLQSLADLCLILGRELFVAIQKSVIYLSTRTRQSLFEICDNFRSDTSP